MRVLLSRISHKGLPRRHEGHEEEGSVDRTKHSAADKLIESAVTRRAILLLVRPDVLVSLRALRAFVVRNSG
jgi:hypothetical protein